MCDLRVVHVTVFYKRDPNGCAFKNQPGGWVGKVHEVGVITIKLKLSFSMRVLPRSGWRLKVLQGREWVRAR